jgi:predicted O-methyltransferase YrrM
MNAPIGQNLKEFDRLIALAVREKTARYLEIGCRFGGAFDRMVRSLPKDGRYVALDLPMGKWGKKSRPTLERVVANLKRDGWTDTRAIFGDSHDPHILRAVTRLSPFDLIFIDADHSYDAVCQDWFDYGPLGRLVAFHDINGAGQRDHSVTYTVEVPKLWEAIKDHHRHAEFIDPADRYGIGVLWT